MTAPIHIPDVPTGFTGVILWIRKTASTKRGYRYRLDLVSRNRQYWFHGEHYPTRSHAYRAAKSLAGARSKPWIIV